MPCRWKKMVITIGFLVVWNLWFCSTFVSGGGFGGENFGLKAKKKTVTRGPPKIARRAPLGGRWRRVLRTIFHHNTPWASNDSWETIWNCAAAQVQRSKIEKLMKKIGVSGWNFWFIKTLKMMISWCLEIDLWSFGTHFESFGYLLTSLFKKSIKNDTKMTPKLVVSR